MSKVPFAIAAAAVCVATLASAPGAALAADGPREAIAPAFAYPIANVPGKTLTAVIVTYPPGGTTPPHRHGRAFVVGYVLEGAIRSKLGSGEEKVYKAGESWTENPGAHHVVSANASTTEPAKLLAFLIADSKQKDLVTFDGAPPKK